MTMRLPKRIEAPKEKEAPKDTRICCADCKRCKPITSVPNLDYKGEPFLCTCDRQPWEMMMYRKHDCKYYENDNG